jgi:hypothetical protein
MNGLTNNLIMLLSTDWFKPYWETIGITMDEPEKSAIQEGCRQIVQQIMSGATEYWLISFSPDHSQETLDNIKALAKKHKADEAINRAVEEWSIITEEDMKAGWLFETITEDLLSDGSSMTEYALDSNLKTIVWGMRKNQIFTEVDFAELSIKSRSSWDRYITQLTPNLPTYLSDILFTFLKARSFKAFWIAILGNLTREQCEELTSWYQNMARSRAKRVIAPTYFPGNSC